MPEKQMVKKSAKNAEKRPDKRSGGTPSFFVKAFARLYRMFVLPFKNMVAELKKVTWPTREALTNYSIVVVSFMVLMAVVIGLLDMGASALLQALIQKG